MASFKIHRDLRRNHRPWVRWGTRRRRRWHSRRAAGGRRRIPDFGRRLCGSGPAPLGAVMLAPGTCRRLRHPLSARRRLCALRAALPGARGERRRLWAGVPQGLPRGLAKRTLPHPPLRSPSPTGTKLRKLGGPTLPRTCPHLALSFARPYLGLSFGTSTKMWLLEEESQILKERPGGHEQRPRLLRARRSRCSKAPGFPASLGVRRERTAHAPALLCPANQPHHSGEVPALLACTLFARRVTKQIGFAGGMYSPFCCSSVEEPREKWLPAESWGTLDSYSHVSTCLHNAPYPWKYLYSLISSETQSFPWVSSR